MPGTPVGPGGSAGDDAPQPEESIAAPNKNVGNHPSQVLMTKKESRWY
jgi:hypothetical protein